jgi:hypothetical protein
VNRHTAWAAFPALLTRAGAVLEALCGHAGRHTLAPTTAYVRWLLHTTPQLVRLKNYARTAADPGDEDDAPAPSHTYSRAPSATWTRAGCPRSSRSSAPRTLWTSPSRRSFEADAMVSDRDEIQSNLSLILTTMVHVRLYEAEKLDHPPKRV